MNVLIFKNSELEAGSIIRLEGERADHLRSVLKVNVGQRLRVGELNGSLGSGLVLAISKRAVEVEVEALTREPLVPWIDLVLALPRPIILRRVLQIVASMGVGRLMLIQSARVEKSYFSSPLLKTEQIEHFLRLGLEQSGNTVLPQVTIHKKFPSFIDEEFRGSKGEKRFVAHPGVKSLITEVGFPRAVESESLPVMAIGPEGGWLPVEVNMFENAGFVAFSMGERILRVDTVIPVVLGQCGLLRELAENRRC